jgi:hypothetical protein
MNLTPPEPPDFPDPPELYEVEVEVKGRRTEDAVLFVVESSEDPFFFPPDYDERSIFPRHWLPYYFVESCCMVDDSVFSPLSTEEGAFIVYEWKTEGLDDAHF